MSDRDELIAKARALSEPACDGPWHHCCASGTGCGGVMVWAASDQENPVAHADKDHVNSKNNMAFIAESRTLLPALADLAESEGRRADEAEAAVSNLRRDNKALNDLVLAIERALDISGYRAGESEEEICPRIEKLKGQGESMRLVVEAVRRLQVSQSARAHQDALSDLETMPLPPKEQP